MRQSDANNVKKCKGVSDPPEPSQSCTSPAPPPPHMSFSTEPSNYSGWQSVHSTLYGRVDKRQNHGLARADEYNARKGTEVIISKGKIILCYIWSQLI